MYKFALMPILFVAALSACTQEAANPEGPTNPPVLLWQHGDTSPEEHPLVVDINGDGKDDVISVSPREISSLNGATGAPIWTYTFPASTGWGPLLAADLLGTGKPLVIAGTTWLDLASGQMVAENQFDVTQLVDVDGNGTLEQLDRFGSTRTLLDETVGYGIGSVDRSLAFDVDGAGRQEIIVAEGRYLGAMPVTAPPGVSVANPFQPDYLWRNSVGFHIQGAFIDRLTDDDPASLVVWGENTLLLVDPVAGSERWRVELENDAKVLAVVLVRRSGGTDAELFIACQPDGCLKVVDAKGNLVVDRGGDKDISTCELRDNALDCTVGHTYTPLTSGGGEADIDLVDVDGDAVGDALVNLPPYLLAYKGPDFRQRLWALKGRSDLRAVTPADLDGDGVAELLVYASGVVALKFPKAASITLPPKNYLNAGNRLLTCPNTDENGICVAVPPAPSGEIDEGLLGNYELYLLLGGSLQKASPASTLSITRDAVQLGTTRYPPEDSTSVAAFATEGQIGFFAQVPGAEKSYSYAFDYRFHSLHADVLLLKADTSDTYAEPATDDVLTTFYCRAEKDCEGLTP